MQKRNLISNPGLNKSLVLVLLSAFFLLLVDVKVEHTPILNETWKAWIPLAYCLAMILLIPAGLMFWTRGGRKLLMFAFGAATVVGLLGFWFHSDGNPLKGLYRVVSVLAATPGPSEEREHKAGDRAVEDEHDSKIAGPHSATSEMKENEEESPPLLAPLGFFGLGLIGLLACLAKFQQVESQTTKQL
ncbi:MAG: hypothetical protein K2W95_20160 [Candidatus Obscuribacterales bacterium]|nr:hypothetical protein [Candidatus Obscuribacterales bacterium]